MLAMWYLASGEIFENMLQLKRFDLNFEIIFFGMEEFYSYKEKTLQKRQSRETKYNTTTTKKI